MENPPRSFDGIAGLAAMLLSGIALVAVVVQLTAGPFAPKPTLEDNIADAIVDLKDALERRASGQPAPAVQPKGWDIDRILITASISVAGVGMLFGAIALARKEPRLPALLGFGLGAGTLFVVWLQWIAFLALGALLIVALLSVFEIDISV